MAKSKNFFGIRSGSTKNFTFSELNGQQITKERVTRVKNPRTISQMRQRMLMSTIGAAYSYLKVIADHSFEGKTVGQQNMSEFMRLNLDKFKEASRNSNAAYAFNAYGDKLINPMRYILAKGSLASVPFAVNSRNQIEISVSADTLNTAKDVYDALGIKEGDMLTFVWVVGQSSLVKGVFNYTPSTLNIVRLIADKVGTIATPHDAFTYDSNHSDLDISVTLSGGLLTLASSAANFGGVIMSRKAGGQWLRSNTVMVGNKSIIEGVSVENQLTTYPIESELILNGGEMQTSPIVTVLPAPELKLSASKVSITTAGGKVNSPTLTGNAGNGEVTYTISNESIATIDNQTGEITAVGNGSTVVTVHVAATASYSAASITFNVVVSGQTQSGGSGSDGSGSLPGGDDGTVGM